MRVVVSEPASIESTNKVYGFERSSTDFVEHAQARVNSKQHDGALQGLCCRYPPPGHPSHDEGFACERLRSQHDLRTRFVSVIPTPSCRSTRAPWCVGPGTSAWPMDTFLRC